MPPPSRSLPMKTRPKKTNEAASKSRSRSKQKAGITTKDTVDFERYRNAAGGWGSLQSVVRSLTGERIPISGARVLMKQNKPDGFMCVSCAWAKPAKPHPFEFCENGAKATAWELTAKRVTPEFFQQHTLTELESWADHDLEEEGRLTAPMRWDASQDRYVETSWDEAFEEIAQELRRQKPDDVVFYTSGRASLETSYLYQLMA